MRDYNSTCARLYCNPLGFIKTNNPDECISFSLCLKMCFYIFLLYTSTFLFFFCFNTNQYKLYIVWNSCYAILFYIT